MARLTLPLAITVLSASITLAAASPQAYDQEAQQRGAKCNNDCLTQAWPEGYCVNEPGCNCNHQDKREKWLCCIADRCDQSVLTDAMESSLHDCQLRNKPYEFDPEAVCGIKLTTSISPTPSPTEGGIRTTPSSEPSGQISPTGSGIAPTQTGADGAAQTSDPAGNGASKKVMFGGVVGAVAGWVALLL
ncbi:hypothetical protein V8F33_005515 [Rhypophila sp. PSN 637]